MKELLEAIKYHETVAQRLNLIGLKSCAKRHQQYADNLKRHVVAAY